MMRPIKFRAWNGYRKIMADYVSAIQNGDTQGTPSSVNVIVNRKNETWDIKNDDVELLQFTGLTDVYGEEIYEGDIVHCENDYQGTDYTGKVMFFNGGFCVWTGGFRNYVWDDMIPKIIGNVHTNPELLEDKR